MFAVSGNDVIGLNLERAFQNPVVRLSAFDYT